MIAEHLFITSKSRDPDLTSLRFRGMMIAVVVITTPIRKAER